MSRAVVTLALLATLILTTRAANAVQHEKLYTFSGGSAGDGFYKCAGAGDVDADGHDDVVVGGGGYAKVFSGRDGKVLYTFKGSTGDGFGKAYGAGDVDADGHDDVIVGAGKANYARVYSGKTGQTLYTFKGDSAADRFGNHLGGAGDVNADGYDDVVVAAWDGEYCRVFSGKNGETLYTFSGFHHTRDGGGDVNGDGYDDLLLGDWNLSGTGGARVFSGKDGSTLFTFYGDSKGDQFGHVGRAGDVNADGYDDAIVGAPLSSAGGYVKVFSGKDGKVLYTFKADSAGDYFGTSVSGAGDLNGDGYDDLVAGAEFGSKNASRCGYARVFSGKDGSVLFTVHGTTTRDYLALVHRAGDVNDDGFDDVVFGAPGDDTNGTDSGSAFVYASAPPTGTVALNDGGISTNTTYVTLSLTWEKADATVTDMHLRNTGDEWGTWISVTSSVTWTLPKGEGVKTVEARFRDADGLVSAVARDTIILDQTAPAGSITLESGADWTGSLGIDVALHGTDLESGVSHVRLREEGGAFGSWIEAGAVVSFSLSPGDGLRTVECEFRDHAGNVSEVAADSIGLDTTPPTGSVRINDGNGFTGSTAVTLAITAADGEGSGVAAMRLRPSGPPDWGPWLPFSANREFNLPSGDGMKGADLQLRDAVGNESATYSDIIILDQAAPDMDRIRINEDRPYVTRGEPLTVEVFARDNMGGSGVATFSVTFDGGKTWSEWYPLLGGGREEVSRPEADGLVTAKVKVRDLVGNESRVSSPATTYLIEDDLPRLGARTKASGDLRDETDVHARTIDLVKGDLLTVKVKSKAALSVDLVRPDGERLVLGRFPEDSRKPGIFTWPAPETGRYLIVVRGDTGIYKLTTKVKQAKSNKKGKGDYTGTEITFDAVAGSTLKLSLKSEGVSPDTLTLLGPDGPVSIAPKGKPGSVKLGPIVLDQGTGTYRIRFAAPVTVSAKWTVKLPK